MSNSQNRNPIEIKISTVVAVAVLLHDANFSTLEIALKKMTAGSPDYFDDEFAIIDIESVANHQFDWAAIIALFKSVGLHAVAVRNANEDEHPSIHAAGLSIDVVNKAKPEIPAAIDHSNPAVSDTAQTPAEPVKPAIAIEAIAPQVVYQHIPAMIVDTPVRAGQRIYARGADLIITASVNNGAEVIADGSIHIYAPLRGRALAGASGNVEARIYASTMEAELVSIAGIYSTFENGFPKLTPHLPVQVKLIGDSIEVSSIKSAT